jgi:hypothetical protein
VSPKLFGTELVPSPGFVLFKAFPVCRFHCLKCAGVAEQLKLFD